MVPESLFALSTRFGRTRLWQPALCEQAAITCYTTTAVNGVSGTNDLRRTVLANLLFVARQRGVSNSQTSIEFSPTAT